MDKRNIAGIFPASAVQQALLVHSLDEAHSDPGIIQVRCTLHGVLHKADFETAWAKTIARTDALRMSVHMTEQQKVLLVLAAQCNAPILWHDLSALSHDTQQAQLDALIDQDKQERLDLKRSPVMRIQVIQISAKQTEVLWTCHHILLDGWSSGIILRDLIAIYSAKRRSIPVQLPAPASYKAYTNWAKSRSQQAAKTYWDTYLADLATCSSLPFHAGLSNNPMEHRARHRLDTSVSDALSRVAANHKAPAATVFYAAWAIVQAAMTRQRDVVFGTTTAGRSPDMPGHDTLSGCFASLLPRRAHVSGNLSGLLAAQHKDGIDQQDNDHLPLGDILHGRPQAAPLVIESLFIVQNQPWEDIHVPVDGGLRVDSFSSGLTTTFPLTMAVTTGDSVEISCVTRAETGLDVATCVALAFTDTLEAIAHDDCHDLELLVARAATYLTFETQDRRGPVDQTYDETKSARAHRPANDTELAIVRIWQDVLGTTDIDTRLNFHQLGGNSFGVLRMLAKVRDQFEVQVPLRAFILDPTVAMLANSIGGAHSDSLTWASLVPIQPSGSQQPIHFLHAGGGHVLFLRGLAEQLGLDRPFYAYQPPGLEGEAETPKTFEALAEVYLADLLSVQPSGPYVIAGHCAGARVGLALTGLLEARGEQVDQLIVFDTNEPYPINATPSLVASRVTRQIRRLVKGDVGAVMSTLKQSYRVAKITEDARQAVSNEERAAAFLRNVHNVCAKADALYVGTPVKARIDLIRSANTPDRKITWGRFCDDDRTWEANVHYENAFFAPDVKELAVSFRRILASANPTG